MAGTGALPPLRRTTSSRSSSMRSASAATWVFSRATLVTRGPEEAWRKKVRRPGSPTVPATKRSGGRRGTPDATRPVSIGFGMWDDRPRRSPSAADNVCSVSTASPYCGRRSRCARTAPDRSVATGGFLARGKGREIAGVPEANEKRPQSGVTDRGDGTRFYGDSLKEVQMESKGVRDKRLDDVAVRAHEVDGIGAVIALHARVPLPHRLGGAGLHGAHGFAAGERGPPTGATGRPPSAARPSARRACGPTSRRSGTPRCVPRCARAARAGVEQRLNRFPAALERAGDDLGDRHLGEAAREGGGLGGAPLVEGDAGRPPGEQSRGVRGGTSVPDEDQRGHAAQPKGAPGGPHRAGSRRRPECAPVRATEEYAQ